MSSLKGPLDQPTKKTCTCCYESLPVSDFHKATANPDGLQRWCIDCQKKNRIGLFNRRAEGGKKQCATCRLEKPVDSFGRRASASDGLNSSCLVCARNYFRSYRKLGGNQ